MSHPFGDLVSQHLHRRHSLSQSKLAAGAQMTLNEAVTFAQAQ